MRIVTGIGQTGGHQNAYQAGPAGQEQQAAGAQERLKDLLARQSAGAGASAGGAGGKPKASLPDDQVGQLAAELANARSRFDVQQVAGKAMRALASLRMTAALCEGRDKAKINRMIARMEKLMKRTRVKIRHLDKEEQLEDREAAGSGGFFENTAAQAAAPLPPADSFAPAQAGLETAAAEGGALDVSV